MWSKIWSRTPSTPAATLFLPALVSLLVPLGAAAQKQTPLTQEELRTIAQHVGKTVNGFQYRRDCVIRARGHDTPKRLVFAFEGFGGYAPRRAAMLKLTGLLAHFKSWGRMSDPFLLNRLIHNTVDTLADTEWFYFSYAGAEDPDVLKCAVDLAKQGWTHAISGKVYYPRMVVLGFSFGGHAALKFADKLQGESILVDLGVTVDPVQQGVDWKKPPVGGFQYPKSVSRWVNYYQQDDVKSMAGLMDIRSFEVVNAENHLLKIGGPSHRLICSRKDIRAGLLDALGKLSPGRTSWKIP